MIDPHALVSPLARLAPDVTVGPFSIIGPDVEIGPGTVVGPHVVINGPTKIGAENRFFQFASIGDAPQDKKYGGEPTRLEIGDRNIFRESCTMNRGTAQGHGHTSIGSDCLFMAYTHVAHDCRIGDKVILANCATMGGHVQILIDSIELISLNDVTHDLAIESGFESRAHLLKVAKHGSGDNVYLVRFRYILPI